MGKDEKNYLQTLLWVMSKLGHISNDMLVNFHKFNSVCPAEMDEQIESLVKDLQRLKGQYRNQHEINAFDMER